MTTKQSERPGPRVLLCLLLGLFSVPGSGEGALEPSATRSVVVGVENVSLLPVYYVDTTGDYAGLLRDLFDAFAQSAGLQVEYRPLSVPALFDAFLAGEVDIKLPDNPMWRPQLRDSLDISYSAPLVYVIDGMIVLDEGHGRELSSLKRVGILRGFTPVSFVAQVNDGSIELVEVDDFNALFRMLVEREIDAIYGSTAMAEYYLNNIDLMNLMRLPMNSTAIRFDASLPHQGSDYFLSSLRRPELVREFDTWLAANRGTLRDLIARWGLSERLLDTARGDQQQR